MGIARTPVFRIMSSAPNGSLTVVVTRKIKANHEADFEAAMAEFTAEAWRFPGHLGMQMLRSVEKLPGREYTIIARFESLDARRAFTASPFYSGWMERLALLSDGSPSVCELTGIAGLFPSANGPVAPQKWKMAVTVWIGVFTLGQIFYFSLFPWIGAWPRIAQSGLVSAIVVALLTWFVLPAATRWLHGWYFSQKDESGR